MRAPQNNFVQGQSIGTVTAKDFNDAADFLEAVASLSVVPPLVSKDGDNGRSIALMTRPGFYARMIGDGNPYGFQRLIRKPDLTFEDDANGEKAPANPGTTDYAAYEVNAVTGLAGTRQWLIPGFENDYRFQDIGDGGGVPVCLSCDLSATDTLTATYRVWEWNIPTDGPRNSIPSAPYTITLARQPGTEPMPGSGVAFPILWASDWTPMPCKTFGYFYDNWAPDGSGGFVWLGGTCPFPVDEGIGFGVSSRNTGIGYYNEFRILGYCAANNWNFLFQVRDTEPGPHPIGILNGKQFPGAPITHGCNPFFFASGEARVPSSPPYYYFNNLAVSL